MSIVIETIGWLGSALILVSLSQAQPRRLHLLNIGACIILIAYNTLIGAIPGIGLNAGLILVNLWRLRQIARERRLENHGSPYPALATAPRLDKRERAHR